jgi:competence protein ComEA
MFNTRHDVRTLHTARVLRSARPTRPARPVSPARRTGRLTGSFLVAALLCAALPTLAAETGKKVNINTADASQLALLPRIGPSVAGKIVAFRKENGPFKSPEDLLLVPGIGEKTFALLKPYLATAGETTLKEKVKAGKVKDKDPKEKGAAG